MMEPTDWLKPIIDRANASLEVKPGDTYDENGLLICGKCGQPKQILLTQKYMGAEREIKVRCSCACEQEASRIAEEAERKREDEEIIKKLRSASLLDERFKNSTFDRFEVTKYNERNLKLCRRYATGFNEMIEKNQGLLFWGDTGTGKSFAAACIVNYLLDHKIPAVMTSIMRLTEMIMNKEEQESTIINRLNRAKLVVFDDFGAERDTEYVMERAYSIIDARCGQRLPMIVTTNLTFQEMERESSVKYKRIYDRILGDCYPMQFGGKSWRRKEAAKRFDEMEDFLNG